MLIPAQVLKVKRIKGLTGGILEEHLGPLSMLSWTWQFMSGRSNGFRVSDRGISSFLEE